MSPQQKLALLHASSHARRQTEAYFDTIAHAAILAANQVQDKRLDFVEQPPSIQGSDLFFEVLLGIALESSVAGAIIRSVTKRIFERVLATRQVFLTLGGRSDFGEFLINEIAAAEAKWIAAGRRVTPGRRAALISYFLRGNQGSDLYSDDVFQAIDRGAMVIHSAVKKAAVPLAKAPKARRLLPADSPGTTVMDSALTYTLRQKTFSNIGFDQFDATVLCDQIPADAYADLMTQFAQYMQTLDERYGLNDIKRVYAEFFELSIWVSLFLANKPKQEQQTSMRFTGPGAILISGDSAKNAAFTDYLLARTHVPDYVLEREDYLKPFRDLPPDERLTFDRLIGIRAQRTGTRPDQAKLAVVFTLLQYLVKIGEAAIEIEQRTPPEGRTEAKSGS